MNPYLGFGTSDAVQGAALAGSLVTFAVATQPRLRNSVARIGTRATLGALALTAALLSAGYVAYYLRFGPRIVDATHYYLEARALARGHLVFPVPEPSAAFSGRFLLNAHDASGLGVLFPPGYPAVLALAFLVRAPLALGPLLAALLVFATYWLARELGAEPRIALGAAALSVVSAALRYHTADTMSHGWAALLVAVSMAAAARASTRSLPLSGLALGWLVATRPVTGAVALLAALWLAKSAKWQLARLGVGLVPGLALLIAHQHAVTGAWLRSTQAAYYAVADGPPGCFRYGFGAGTGCWFEHGDFVRARLADGYGFSAALANTLRRLGVHALDIANAAPLAIAALIGLWQRRSERRVRVAAGLVLGVVLAYAPFYFEGSYPGGGARFFADVLPVEHVFVAFGLAALGLLRFGVPVALLGFALHTGNQHALLGAREGGRPMFEPSVLRDYGVDAGLVFVATDHGFALGHEPGQLSARSGVVVARAKNDALDALLWAKLGRPPAYAYVYDAASERAVPRLVPWTAPGVPGSPFRVEAESLWPALSVAAGWAHPDFSAEPCASHGRGLRLRATGDLVALRLDLPTTGRPTYARLGWVGAAPPALMADWSDEDAVRRSVRITWEGRTGSCARSAAFGPLPGSLSSHRLGGLAISGATGLLDYIELTDVD